MATNNPLFSRSMNVANFRCHVVGGQADLMLQYDNSEDNKCTCLLLMKPNEYVTKLLELWIQAIIDEKPKDDQASTNLAPALYNKE